MFKRASLLAESTLTPSSSAERARGRIENRSAEVELDRNKFKHRLTEYPCFVCD
jgi:hypothetical protein